MLNINQIDEFITQLPQDYIVDIQKFKEQLQQSYKSQYYEIETEILNIAGQIQILDNFMRQQQDIEQIYQSKSQYENNYYEDENLKNSIVEDQQNMQNFKQNLDTNIQTLSNLSREFELTKSRVSQLGEQIQILKNETQVLIDRMDRNTIVQVCSFSSPPQLLYELLYMFILIVFNQRERDYSNQRRYLHDVEKFRNKWKDFDESTLSDRTYHEVVNMFEIDSYERARVICPLTEALFIFIKNTLEIYRIFKDGKPIIQYVEHLSNRISKLQDQCQIFNKKIENIGQNLQELIKKQDITSQYIQQNKDQYLVIKIKCQVFDNINQIIKLLNNKKEQLEIDKIGLLQQTFIEQIQILNLNKPIFIIIQELQIFLNTNQNNLSEFQLLQMRIRKLLQLENSIIYIYDPHLVSNYINLNHNITKNENYHIISNLMEFKSLYLQQYQVINLDININCLIQIYQDYTYLNQYQNQKQIFNQQQDKYTQKIINYIKDADIERNYIEIIKYEFPLNNKLTISYYNKDCPEICASIYFQLHQLNQKLHFLQIPDIFLKNTEWLSFEWFSLLLNGMLQYTDQKTLLNITMINQQKLWNYCFKQNEFTFTNEQKEQIIQLYLQGIENLQISKCLIGNFVLSFYEKYNKLQSLINTLQSEYKTALEYINTLVYLHKRVEQLEQFQEEEKLIDAELMIKRKIKQQCIDYNKDQQLKLQSTTQLLQVEKSLLQTTIQQIKIRQIKLSLKDCYEVTKQETPDDLTYKILEILMDLINQPFTWVTIKSILSNSHYLNQVTNLDMDTVNQDWINKYLQFKMQHPFIELKQIHESIGIQHIYKFLDQIVTLYSLNQDKKQSIIKIHQYEQDIKEFEQNISQNELKQQETIVALQQMILEEQQIEIKIKKEKQIQDYLKQYKYIEDALIIQTDNHNNLQNQVNTQQYEICALKVFEEMIINEPYLVNNKQKKKSFLIYQGNFKQIELFSQHCFQLSLDMYSINIWRQQRNQINLNLIIQQRYYINIFSMNSNNREITPLDKLSKYWHLINSINRNLDIQKIFTDKLFIFTFNAFQLLINEYQLYETTLPIISKIITGLEQEVVEGIVQKSFLFNQLVDETIHFINKDLQNLYLLQLTYLILSIYNINQCSSNEIELHLQIKNGNLLQDKFKINLKQQTLETMEIRIKELFKRNNIDQQFINGNNVLNKQQ